MRTEIGGRFLQMIVSIKIVSDTLLVHILPKYGIIVLKYVYFSLWIWKIYFIATCISESLSVQDKSSMNVQRLSFKG